MPSKKHNELAGMALTWLGNKVSARGYRGTTEICIAQGYVADAVALCSLQGRFNGRYLRHSGYTPPICNYHYNKETGKVDCVIRGDEINNYYTCIFEVKVSRTDFLGTFNGSDKHKNRHKPIGSLHWVVTPKGLIKPDELPDFWGLLETRGGGLSEKKLPLINILEQNRFNEIAHDLIWPLEKHRGYLNCKECGASCKRWSFPQKN